MSNDNKLLAFENFSVDRQQRILLHNNKHVQLTPKAFDILLVLIENKNRIVSKTELMERVWPGIAVEEGNITKNISYLRKILANGNDGNGDDGQERLEQESNKYIVTISKRGYRFIQDVKEISAATVEQAATEQDLHFVPSALVVEVDDPGGKVEQQAELPESQSLPALSKSYSGSLRRLPFSAILLLIGILAGAVAVGIILRPFLANEAAEVEDVEVRGWKAEQGPDLLKLSLSPDGKLIAYSKNETGHPDIYIGTLPGFQTQVVTSDEWSDYNPIWSPDSRRIAYVSNRLDGAELWTTSMLGGEGEKIESFKSPQVQLLHWSADGKRIFYVASQELYSLNLASREKVKLASFGENVMTENLSISPDEQSIAYSAKSNAEFQIFIARIDGSGEQQITTTGEYNGSPVWFPDGKRILHTSKKGDFYQVHIVSVDGRRQDRMLHNRQSAKLVRLAPDGKTIFYQVLTGESDIYRMNLASGEEAQLASQTLLEMFPEVSPNGEAVAFHQANPESNVLQGKILIQSASIKDQILATISNGFDVRWSKDSTRVAFLRSNSLGILTLWIAGSDGADQRQATQSQILPNAFSPQLYGWAQPYNFSWSPVAELLAFNSLKSGASNIWIVSASDRSERMISSNANSKLTAICPVWSPTGDRLAYLVQGSGTAKTSRRIMMQGLAAESGEGRLLYQTDAMVRMVGWSADGSGFLFGESVQDKPGPKITDLDLKQVTLAQNNVTPLKRLTAVYFNSLRLSPAGDFIIYIARQNNCDNIRQMSLKDYHVKELTSNKDPLLHFATLAWSPDQKSIYFSKQSAITVIRSLKNFD